MTDAAIELSKPREAVFWLAICNLLAVSAAAAGCATHCLGPALANVT